MDPEEEILVNLTVPKVVREGEHFFPLLTVSQIVMATFYIYIPDRVGTAQNRVDFLFDSNDGDVFFHLRSTTSTTPSSINVLTDRLVEPNEKIDIVVLFTTSPCDMEDLLKFTNQNETVNIIDDNSELMCISSCYFHTLMGCICFHVILTFEYNLVVGSYFIVRRQATTPMKTVLYFQSYACLMYRK